MCCICLGFSHTLSSSHFDPKMSHMKYVTPDTVTMTVWLKDTIHLTFVFGLSKRSFKMIFWFFDFLIFWFFGHQKKDWLTICTTQRSVVQILVDEKSLGVWPNTQPTNPSCMSENANTSTPCGILQLFFYRIISIWNWTFFYRIISIWNWIYTLISRRNGRFLKKQWRSCAVGKEPRKSCPAVKRLNHLPCPVNQVRPSAAAIAPCASPEHCFQLSASVKLQQAARPLTCTRYGKEDATPITNVHWDQHRSWTPCILGGERGIETEERRDAATSLLQKISKSRTAFSSPL